MEIRKENTHEIIVFVLPSDPEEQIAALAVVREYWAVCKQTENLTFEIHLENVLPNLQYLSEQFASTVIHYDQPYIPNTDLRFVFDTERAHAISHATDKHIVQAYGILLGVEPTIFPKLPDKSDWGSHLADILVLNNFKKVDEVLDLIANHLPEYSCLMVHPGDFTRNTQLIKGGKLFIGARGADTYLAAATFKPVIELYDTKHSKGWLSKWTNGNYIMIYGDHIDTELIWRAIERVTLV